MKTLKSFFTTKPDRRQVLNFILLFASIFLFLVFWFHPEYYTTGSMAKGNLSFAKKKILVEFVFLAGCCFLIFFPRKFLKDRKRLDRGLAIFLTLLTPVITYLVTTVVVRGMPINFSKKTNLPLLYSDNRFFIIIFIFCYFQHFFEISIPKTYLAPLSIAYLQCHPYPHPKSKTALS